MISVGTGVLYTPVPICFLDSLSGRNSMRNCSAKGAAFPGNFFLKRIVQEIRETPPERA